MTDINPRTNLHTTPVHKAIDDTTAAAHESVDAARDMASRAGELTRRGVSRVRTEAARAGESASGCIKSHPLQSVMVAAAGGAVLFALLSSFGRSRRS
ncbi:MAG: hypothetical protein KKD25_06030 [Gammaproteobacteria bacterium]|jgi:ElaB/YqjD/DUF883 family membrane-anchored ribosome-binding protein|nr:hypothetical protein [Gammaproteobacteria bacterium]MBU0773335.1 hypothetical protein [Gammaproteobacteria bacterium]MBU0854727.1 hypothetical protein [Gammaproteobacteria bacterium]MBU1846697.1 hypothetical protein [Gammaproteobacteria bacterium]